MPLSRRVNAFMMGVIVPIGKKRKAVMAKLGWTLWASIQDAISPLDFDYWDWGMGRYDRALRELAGPEFAGWVEAVSVPHTNTRGTPRAACLTLLALVLCTRRRR